MGHREQLLVAARRLLEEKGYAHITARDLVAESGTNLASIGYHFGSKAALLNEAIGAILDEWTEQLAAVAMADREAPPMVRGVITWRTMLETLADKRSLLLSFTEALAQAERSPELREQLAGYYRRCRARVAELVAESLGDELAADDPRCAAIASFVIAVCDGLAIQCLLNPADAPSPDALTEGLASMWAASLGPDAPTAAAG